MRAETRLLVAGVASAWALGCQTAGNALESGDGGAKTECATCHMAEFAQVRNPLHEGKKPITCGICHAQDGWRPSRIDHPWALTGKHEKADCFACHSGNPPVFKNTGQACIDCHAKEYEPPPFADHMLFQKACAECHTTTDWKTLVPKPIWPPDDGPKGADAGAREGGSSDVGPHDEALHDAGAGNEPKPKPKPQPRPQPHPPPHPPPDVTTGGSRHIRR